MEFEDIAALQQQGPGAKTGKSSSPDEMTLRERFRRTMFYQECPVKPNFEFGYWERTLAAWRDQGLPDHVVDEKTAYEYFGIENVAYIPANPMPLPIVEAAVLEEDENRQVYRDAYGCVAEINKKGDKSIPHFIDFPVKDRATWEPFKAALDPDSPQRWAGFEDAVSGFADSKLPVGVTAGSLLGVPRNLMGFERIATMPYEDEDLFREIVDTFGACIVAVLDRALAHVQVDFALGWEDICFNHGPIVAPDAFRAVAGPWYRRIADVLNAHGCCVYGTDCDGNITPVADIFLDNGLNTMFPVEVNGGSDPCDLRERYGKRIRLWGGVDKMVLLESREAIDRELERLRPYVEQGGFIPTVDHRVQADVPYANYLYYLDRKRELYHVGGEPAY